MIDASLYDSLMFVMSVGAITSSGSITLTVYKGTAAAAASITSSVASAAVTGTGDNTQKIIDVDCSAEGNFRYYKGTMVANAQTTTGGCYASLVVFGNSTRFGPATDNDLSSAAVSYA